MKRKNQDVASTTDEEERSKRARSIPEDTQEEDVIVDTSSDSGASDDLVDLSQNPGFIGEHQTDIEVGVIEKIIVTNFLCHGKQELALGSNVNFIVGPNGSGKSAIVTALVVGLGGKASITNRGTNMNSFIKTGRQSGEVEIKMRNRGPDAFRPEQYGESIIVNRRFTSDGSSQYKLKSKEGKVISTKKEDLTKMLEQFNIQIDNPLAILNQDSSKNFLHSKSPHDRYRFFLKATQLEQINEDYNRAKDYKDTTTAIIAKNEESMPKLEKEVLEWEQKFKSLTAIDELKTKYEKLKHELAWAHVHDKEKGMQPIMKEKKDEESRLPLFKSKADEHKAKLDEVNQRMSTITARLTASGDEVNAIKPLHLDAKGALTEEKKVTRNAQMEVKRIEGLYKHSKKEKSELQERITQIQSSANHNYEAVRRARMEKIDALEAKLTSYQAQGTSTDHQLDQFRSAITKYKSDTYKLSQEIQALQGQIDKMERNVKAMRASQGNRLKRFGPNILQLKQAIDTNQGFHKKPIGPLGSCFTLRDSNWALAIECCLKGLMHSFCCHDFHDEKLLQRLFAEHNYKGSVIVSKFKNHEYDTSSKGADTSTYPSVLNMIQGDHPMVTNTLIDQRTIECVLLIEGSSTARQIMDPDNRPGPPHNAREAYTLRGDQVMSAPTFRYYSSNQNTAKCLTANLEQDIANMLHTIDAKKQSRSEFQQQTAQLEVEIRKNKMEERKCETQVIKINEAKRKVSMEIEELKNVDDPTPVDIATYEDEVRQIDEQLTSTAEQLRTKKNLHQEHSTQLKELETKFRGIEAELKAKIDAADLIKEEVNNIAGEIENCKAMKKHYETKLKGQEKKVKDIETRIEKYKADVEVDVKKAEQIHAERIVTQRTPKSLVIEITQMEKQMQDEERQRGDPVVITREYKMKKDAFLKIRKEVRQVKMFCKKLDHAVALRLKKYHTMRKLIALRTKLVFIGFLHSRHYTGTLHFSHPTQSLEITVEPIKVDKGQGSKDLRSLSGGERSFSTMCFILALWETCHPPFRCLDEFDIFMDMVNRRIAMEMMMHTADSQKERQFIFVTPQSMSNMGVSADKVKIFRMQNPDRGHGRQTTLTGD